MCQATDVLMTVAPRTLQGLLKGYDQATNLILDECHERVYSTKVWCNCLAREKVSHEYNHNSLQVGVEKLALGLYVIRGDNM